MNNLKNKMEILSQYLESIFEQYSFKNVGKNEAQNLGAIYRRGIIDKYFKVKKPLTPPPPEVNSICKELVNKIFTPNNFIKADVSVFFESSKMSPKKGNAALYITGLWMGSIIHLDEIYFSLTDKDYSLLKNFVKPADVPTRRSSLFSWILYKLAEFIETLPSSLKYYGFVKYSIERNYLNPHPSILKILFDSFSEVLTVSPKELMREIFTKVLTEQDPKSALLRWVGLDQSIRNDLYKAFDEDPIWFMNGIQYSNLKDRFSDLKNMKSKTGMNEGIIFKGTKIWGEKNLAEIMACTDVLSDPSSVSRWSDFLGKELAKRIEKISREFKTPLHERNVPRISPEHQAKYGDFRLIYDSKKAILSQENDEPIESTNYHILQKLVSQTWAEVLRIETYSFEKELYDSKEYESSGPEFHPQIFVDEEQGNLYIEKTDGTLFYSQNQGRTWEAVKGEVKIFLYEKRLNSLKYFEVPAT